MAVRPAGTGTQPGATALSAVRPLRDDDPYEAGPVTLAAWLGEGPVGCLYLGRDGEGRTLAVKVIHPGLARDRFFRIRLARELERLRTVSGPYLSQVTGGDADGSPAWLATAYVPAISLREAVTALGPMGAGAVRRLAVGIARALQAIHAANVLHLRLTPANVLLTESGPLVTDFGIALVMNGSTLTASGARPQWPAFLAPEQVAGGPVGTAADVFALGGLLAYALTGSPPFGDDGTEAVMARIIRGAPDLTAACALDGYLAALINACLDKDPLARPRLAHIQARTGAADPSDGWLPAPLAALVRRRAAEAAAALDCLPPEPGARRHVRPRNGRRRRESAGPAAALAAAVHSATETRPRGTGRTIGGTTPMRSGPRSNNGPPSNSGPIASRGRKRHRRISNPPQTRFWLVPLILFAAVVAASTFVTLNGSTLIFGPTPGSPRPHSPAAAPPPGRGQPGGTPFGSGHQGGANDRQGGANGQPQHSPPPQPRRSQQPNQRHQPQHGNRMQQAREPQHPLAYVATAGPFCPPTRSAGIDADNSLSGIGWYTAAAARAANDGCGNKFLFSPLAEYGSGTRDDNFDWVFHTGLPAPHCTLSFFVPFSARANSNAVIWISNGSHQALHNPAVRIASFTINQADSRGQWLSVGPFVFNGGTVFAELTNAGNGPYGGTVVASAVRVACP